MLYSGPLAHPVEHRPLKKGPLSGDWQLQIPEIAGKSVDLKIPYLKRR